MTTLHPGHLTNLRAARTVRTLDIIRRYTNGEPVQTIADRYGMHRTAISRVCAAAGIPKRPKHFPERISKGVLRDYRRGDPIKAIAQRWSVSQAYVSTLATKHGINRR